MSTFINTQLSSNHPVTPLNKKQVPVVAGNVKLKEQIAEIGKADPARASFLSRQIVLWDGTQKKRDALLAEGLHVSHFVFPYLLGGMITSKKIKQEEEIDLSNPHLLVNKVLTRAQFEERYEILKNKISNQESSVDVTDFSTMKKQILNEEQFEQRYEFLDAKGDKTKSEQAEFACLEKIAEELDTMEEGKKKRRVFGHPKFNYYDVDFDLHVEESITLSKEIKKEWKILSDLKKHETSHVLEGMYDIPINSNLTYSVLFPTQQIQAIQHYQALCTDFETFPREGVAILKKTLERGSFYAQTISLQSEQSDAVFRAVFIDALKHSYGANLNLLRASNLMVSEPEIYFNILNIYTEAFNLYQDQISFNNKNNNILLEFSKNDNNLLLRIMESVGKCGPDLKEGQEELFKESSAIRQKILATDQEFHHHLRDSLNGFLEKIKTLEERLKKSCEMITGKSKDFQHCLQELSKFSEEIKAQTENLQKKRELHSKTIETLQLKYNEKCEKGEEELKSNLDRLNQDKERDIASFVRELDEKKQKLQSNLAFIEQKREKEIQKIEQEEQLFSSLIEKNQKDLQDLRTKYLESREKIDNSFKDEKKQKLQSNLAFIEQEREKEIQKIEQEEQLFSSLIEKNQKDLQNLRTKYLESREKIDNSFKKEKTSIESRYNDESQKLSKGIEGKLEILEKNIVKIKDDYEKACKASKDEFNEKMEQEESALDNLNKKTLELFEKGEKKKLELAQVFKDHGAATCQLTPQSLEQASNGLASAIASIKMLETSLHQKKKLAEDEIDHNESLLSKFDGFTSLGEVLSFVNERREKIINKHHVWIMSNKQNVVLRKARETETELRNMSIDVIAQGDEEKKGKLMAAIENQLPKEVEFDHVENMMPNNESLLLQLSQVE